MEDFMQYALQDIGFLLNAKQQAAYYDLYLYGGSYDDDGTWLPF